ncbi:protein MTSS 2 isoform X2 [Aphidius gifuensis]|uniref:protein MTSS 2 isoform X2 n=1 Tax=Aphidius gifuensis TaxID=684658 RepID=UPI001CDB8427|nr:protein MTSS 2 isoform X2 [Aphidius gifuensis]XP_044003903.1 protein MTSS 2 isoform X2 [Aphidius gifuensis]XP_044003904.1 protein MTSS 2 isoform X2 [Aphidius gifuensis]
MDVNVERECSALGGLFHQIINDMKNGAPLWEDFISKATKLHVCLRAAILAVSAYLEAFQKIADAATNARGATKEIGTALTRICLRHKAVETRMKSFTCTIMDRLVMPLQEKLEDWKKTLINLDKEHAKEYKKVKSELKKRSTDTLRLQKKKARKGTIPNHGHNQLSNVIQSQSNRIDDLELNRLLETSTASVHEKRMSLEETERKAVRAALLEERGRFCQFAKFLKPVLDEEILMLVELTHLQEVSEQLERHVSAPFDLPAASEQVITDLKGRDNIHWTLSTPPSSPSLSLGSRKSSMCSISSLTSSSSESCKNQPSLCGHLCRRSLSQVSNVSFQSSQSNCPTKTTTNSTWPDLQETTIIKNQNQQNTTINERPHTISSTYEKGHQRPALSVYTFQAPDTDCCHSQPASPVSSPSSNLQLARVQSHKKSVSGIRPPIPSRCSSLERTITHASSSGSTSSIKTEGHGSRGKAKLPIPVHLAKELGNHQLAQQPMYVNMHELANLAANKAQEMHIPAAVPTLSTATGQHASGSINDKTETIVLEKDCGGSQTSESSIESSSGYGSQSTLPNSSSILKQNESTIAVELSTIPRKGSMQQQSRPMPPTRRTTQIIGDNFSNTAGSFVGVTGSLLAATDSNRTDIPAVTISDETENLPPPPAFLLEGNSPAASPTSKRSMSVSETVRTLTELRHTPASPSFLRKSANQPQQLPNSNTGIFTQITTRSQTLRRVSTTSIESTSSISGQNQSGVGGVGQGFMAVLSSKLINNSNVNSPTGCSPKSIRKINTDITNKNQRTSTGLLETLSAKLSAQQQQSKLLQNTSPINNPLQVMTNQPICTSSRSASVRRKMANRIPIVDQNQVRGSLMDQIRRGTSLKKTSGPINDRSAPKIY